MVCTEYVYTPSPEGNPSLASQAIGNWPDSLRICSGFRRTYTFTPSAVLEHRQLVLSLGRIQHHDNNPLFEDLSMMPAYKEQRIQTVHRSDITQKQHLLERKGEAASRI
jgi:hypothetical protein